jgi:hypothetical protein
VRYWSPESDEDPGWPDGWTDGHRKIFRAMLIELRQHQFVPPKFITLGQGPRKSILFKVNPPVPPSKKSKKEPPHFLALDIVSPTKLLLHDGGASDIGLRVACEDARLKAPKLNYSHWKEERAKDPFFVVEGPLLIQVVFDSEESADEIASRLGKFLNFVCRAAVVSLAARRARKAKKKSP